MSEYKNPATFVNVKRVNVGEQDAKGRDRYKFTLGIGTDKNGTEVNGLDQLIEALEALRGKQANLEFRVEDKEGAGGRTFKTAFLMVTEMIPKDDPRNVTFVPKTTAKSNLKASADRIRKSVEG